MRLTLRTMLAYLDDVLEPADTEEMGRKIDESEFASKLVYRIRSSMKKLRLGAPKLEGKGMGLDPNTVAEYLDSTLSPDRVPDFEKVCLESDVHLAEVAACHQVLTLVLGEPAQVDPELRNRVYAMGKPVPARPQEPAAGAAQQPTQEKAEAAAAKDRNGGAAAKEKQPVAAVAEKAARAKPEVPDYLRASSRPRILPFVVTAALVFLILTITFFAVGPQRIAAWLETPPPATDTDATDDSSDSGEATTTPTESDSAKPELSPDASETDNTTSSTKPAPEAPTNGENGTDAASTPKTGNGLPDNTSLPDPPLPTTPIPAKPEDEPMPEKGDMPPAGTGDAPVEPAPGTVTPVVTPEVKPPAEETPVVADIGRYTSERQVLARYDRTSDAWFRLPPNSPITSADRLLVLPTYRPQIALATGIQLTLIGPAEVEFHAASGDESPRLALRYGRALIVTVGKPRAEIGLNLAGLDAVATLVNADASMAVEVAHYRPPGVDPEMEPASAAVPLVNIWSTKGSVEWSEAGEPVLIDERSVRQYVGANEPQSAVVAKLPDWITMRLQSGIEQIASEDFEKGLDLARPLIVSLEERAQSDRVELRMFASQCLMYLNQFEAFVLSLNNPDNKSFWNTQFDVAQQALARGPEPARLMREAFEKLRGDDGPRLYRLLWGYSPQQLADGADEELVDYLANESMDYRVLAFENLRRITGRTHTYMPHYDVKRLTSRINTWRTKLQDGAIVYETPPLIPASPSSPVVPPATDTPIPEE